MLSRAEWNTYTDEEKFQYVQLNDKDNEDMREVLNLIPECAAHGFCLPHMKDWIKSRTMSVESDILVEQDKIAEWRKGTQFG